MLAVASTPTQTKEAETIMDFEMEFIDVVLVPAGLLIMLVYHLCLLYKYFHQPLSTTMGYENNDKRIWVAKILEVQQGDNVSRGLGVISSNTSAAMTLASISLTLSSLIGVWISNLPTKFFPIQIVYGNTSPSMNSTKYICLLTTFLLAFSCFVQSARNFIHLNYLMSTPGASDKGIVMKVERAVQRGSEFWSLGLRALYFGLNIMLWFFGPIPMFVSSILMVVILYCHDIRKLESDDLHDVLLIY